MEFLTNRVVSPQLVQSPQEGIVKHSWFAITLSRAKGLSFRKVVRNCLRCHLYAWLRRPQCQLTHRDSSILLTRQLTLPYPSQGFAYAVRALSCDHAGFFPREGGFRAGSSWLKWHQHAPTNLGAFRTFGNLEVEPWCPKRLLGLPTGSDKTYALEITCKERHSCPHAVQSLSCLGSSLFTSKPSVTISQSHQNGCILTLYL